MIKPYQVFNKTFKKSNLKKIYDEFIKNSTSTGIDGINNKTYQIKITEEVNIINRKIFDNTYNFSFL